MSPDEREQWETQLTDREDIHDRERAAKALLDRVEALERELAQARAAPPVTTRSPMAEHTQRKLHFVRETSDGIAIKDDQDIIVAWVVWNTDRDLRPDNARRLVACWNALEEYTTEEIETFGPERSPWETPPCKPT